MATDISEKVQQFPYLTTFESLIWRTHAILTDADLEPKDKTQRTAVVNLLYEAYFIRQKRPDQEHREFFKASENYQNLGLKAFNLKNWVASNSSPL